MKLEDFTHLGIFVGLVGIILIVYLWRNLKSDKLISKLSSKVLEAEKKAFEMQAGSGQKQKGLLPQAADGTLSFGTSPEGGLDLNNLFILFSRQLSIYQEQTQARASSSFVFAIIAMFAGIIFVFWGASFLLSEKTVQATVAGSAISSIGAGVSTYITKTFLDVHRLSLQQLNRYFQQPVINDHIVMAQHLANQLETPEARQAAYEVIIARVTALITHPPVEEFD